MAGAPALSSGRHDEFGEKLRETIDRWGDEDPDAPAYLHAYAGDVEKAFDWLEKWLEEIGRTPAQLDAIEFEVKLSRS
jgi:hypothetical protein